MSDLGRADGLNFSSRLAAVWRLSGGQHGLPEKAGALGQRRRQPAGKSSRGARSFARTVEIYGRENFRGQIICRADNPNIKTIADCRGKRWIAVDPTSAGGYLYPLGLFISHGIKKEDFSEIAFAPGPGGKQEKVVLGVYAGKYDVGTIREGTLNVVADKIDISEIRVIANTRWYPGWVYAARRDLAAGIVEKIKKALLKLDYNNPAHRPILEAANIVGIIPSDDHDFDPVRDLAARVGIKLAE